MGKKKIPMFRGSATALLMGAGGEGDSSIREGQGFDSFAALHQPELYFKIKREEARMLGIDPPKSADMADLLEYESRAFKRREKFVPGEDYEAKPGGALGPGQKMPWGI